VTRGGDGSLMHSHDQDVEFNTMCVLKSYNFDGSTFDLVGI